MAQGPDRLKFESPFIPQSSMHVVSVASDLFDFSLHFISFLIISLIILLFLLPDTFTLMSWINTLRTSAEDFGTLAENNSSTENDDTEHLGSTEDENEDGQSSNTCYDQDSDISFKNDTDEEIDTTAIEEEWIEYMERSTNEAIEKMNNAKIRCWMQTHKRMKWRLALRIASLSSERWIVKAAEWNPELSSRYKTYRAIGRRRWEDDINEFFKLEETETEISTESDNKHNKSWIKAAKDCGRWTLLETITQ